ncbi:hypothetical protein MKX01_015752 [Papaver californicum]|nr:hypothetical protein MKX01_015752 [Papaver californicum]
MAAKTPTKRKGNLYDLTDDDLRGKGVFVRVDFDGPLIENQAKITDFSRFEATSPTIQYLIAHGARVILLWKSRYGVISNCSLECFIPKLSELTNTKVRMAPNFVGEDVDQMVAAIPDGGVLLLENVRTHRGEVENDTKFPKKLASLADLYVNDAFHTTGLAHASTERIAKLLKPAVAGLLVKQELKYLVGAVSHHKKPFAATVGGSKLSTKTIEALLDKKAQGCRIGSSFVEESMFGPAKSILQMAKEKKLHLVIPLDFLVRRIGPPHEVKNATIARLPNGWRGVDVGSASINMFSSTLGAAKTKIAKCLADLSGKGATTIVTGGASREYLQSRGLADRISHISMGGPILALLEGRLLPALVASDGIDNDNNDNTGASDGIDNDNNDVEDDKGEDSSDKAKQSKKRSAETFASETPADKKAKLVPMETRVMEAI